MTNITFFVYFFIVPIFFGMLISRFIVLDNPEIKEFKVNMGLNWTIFVLIVIGIIYVVWSEKRNLLDDWVTLGGFLSVATTNLSLGMALKWRKKRLNAKH